MTQGKIRLVHIPGRDVSIQRMGNRDSIKTKTMETQDELIPLGNPFLKGSAWQNYFLYP